ncbi:sigma factor-like helix-turn-helix DNA-binding protein [Micromonospora sp. NPDC049366]|uniref:sigma factor-like helix-turn-helix DNA-binding protein n=1 Tax=Micromonospora sp. NPDC049366 TaxID=3364271 RepID=UPI0037ADF5E3
MSRIRRLDDPHAYLRRALVNNHTSGWRRRRRESLVADIPDVAAPTGGDRTDAAVLRRALLSLPAKQRAVVVLRHYEDLPERQVARARSAPSRARTPARWTFSARPRPTQRRCSRC